MVCGSSTFIDEACASSGGSRRPRARSASSAARPTRTREALLGARDPRLAARRERRLLHHDLVARRDLDVPVAAVERLGPDERRRLGRAPLEVARARRARRAPARGRRAAVDATVCTTLARAIPDRRRRAGSGRRSSRTSTAGGSIATRRCSPSGAASTSAYAADACRCGVTAPVAASTSASCEARVVVEEVLVVLARSACRASRTCCSRPSAPVDSWMLGPIGHDRRRRAARPGRRRHELHEERLLVGHPLHGAAEHRVQPRTPRRRAPRRSPRRPPRARRRPPRCSGRRSACRRRSTSAARRSRPAAARRGSASRPRRATST